MIYEIIGVFVFCFREGKNVFFLGYLRGILMCHIMKINYYPC